MSDLEETFLLHIKAEGLPEPEREYRFHPVRRWRFDFAWLDVKLAVEIEGGVYSGGRHTRGAGFENDAEKYNEAGLFGWTVLRFTKSGIDSLYAIDTVKAELEKRTGQEYGTGDKRF